jgi:hypothetical protein
MMRLLTSACLWSFAGHMRRRKLICGGGKYKFHNSSRSAGSPQCANSVCGQIAGAAHGSAAQFQKPEQPLQCPPLPRGSPLLLCRLSCVAHFNAHGAATKPITTELCFQLWFRGILPQQPSVLPLMYMLRAHLCPVARQQRRPRDLPGRSSREAVHPMSSGQAILCGTHAQAGHPAWFETQRRATLPKQKLKS